MDFTKPISPLGYINNRPIWPIAGAEDESAEGTPPEDQPAIDPVLAKLELLEAQNKALIEATKTAQGQARRAEQISQAAWDAVQQPKKPVDQSADAFTQLINRLDDRQPAEKLIKDALLVQNKTISDLTNEVTTLKGHKQRVEMSQEEQRIRAETMDQLIEYADDLGVDIKVVAGKLGSLETGINGGILWTEGKKILREAKKSGTVSGEQLSDEPTYTDRRGSPGARVRSKKEMEDAYGNGDISTEEYAAWQRKH